MENPPSLALDPALLDRLFFEGRTHNVWLDKPVEDATLKRLYELARMPPTAANSQPARFVFVKSAAAKERLRPTLAPQNVDKSMSAPVTAIVAFDSAFHEQMPKLFPARPEMKDSMGAMPEAAKSGFLTQNTSLQAAYFILACRALGLDCGPMAGFDAAKVNAEFFADSPWRASVLINLGYGDASKLYPRNPRLSFEEACKVL